MLVLEVAIFKVFTKEKLSNLALQIVQNNMPTEVFQNMF